MRRLAPVTATNAISIKDTPERIDAAARLIRAIDKARAEVVIEVQLLEVDRQTMREYGLRFASAGDNSDISGGDSAVVDNSADGLGLSIDDVGRVSGSSLFLAKPRPVCWSASSRPMRAPAFSPIRNCGPPTASPRKRISASAYPYRSRRSRPSRPAGSASSRSRRSTTRRLASTSTSRPASTTTTRSRWRSRSRSATSPARVTATCHSSAAAPSSP